jgi:hypothetical protein
MTSSFDRFLRQYKAQGREKADGYAASHFNGLTDEEKDRAFELLAKEAEDVPETATEWLFYLDPQRAQQVTLDQIAKRKADPYGKNYVRQFELLKYTRDLQYQREMLDEYPRIDAFYKADALHLIRITPETADLEAFLRDLLLTETDPAAIAAAAVGFLDIHHVPENAPSAKPQQNGYFARLKNPSPQTRADAIREIQQQYPLPP